MGRGGNKTVKGWEEEKEGRGERLILWVYNIWRTGSEVYSGGQGRSEVV